MKAAAIAQALSVGVTKAEKATGIARHTLARWLADAQAGGEGSALVVAVQEDAASKFQAIIDQGTSAILERIASPKERLGDVARAVEIAVTAHRLLTGSSTSNLAVNETHHWSDDLTDDQQEAFIAELDAISAKRGFDQLASGVVPDRATIFAMITALESKVAR